MLECGWGFRLSFCNFGLWVGFGDLGKKLWKGGFLKGWDIVASLRVMGRGGQTSSLEAYGLWRVH